MDTKLGIRLRIIFILLIVVVSIVAVTVAGCTTQQAMTPSPTPSPSQTQTTKVVTDMMGRTVTIPDNVNRVATVGSIPAINSILLAMGDGSKIVNGLPDNLKSRCRYEYVFAPNLENAPNTSNTQPNAEVILGLEPDVIFTTDNATLSQFEASNIPVVCLTFSGNGSQTAENIKNDLYLVGEVLNQTDRANTTIQYFDNKIAQVNTTVSSIPLDQRPKVLYANMQTLTASYTSSEWCIAEAGGIPVSDNGRVATSYQFSMEELLNWNPDIIIVQSPSDIPYVYNNTVFSDINAVKKKQVYITPSCMGYFGGSSPEMPIAVEWMASKFYPNMFPENETNNDIIKFYEEFYEYKLSNSQLNEILGGLQ